MKPPRGASNHISKGLAAWSGTGWFKLKEVALGALRALPRYYDLPPPQLSLVMLWWRDSFWQVPGGTKRQDCADERWQEPPVCRPTAPSCATGPSARAHEVCLLHEPIKGTLCKKTGGGPHSAKAPHCPQTA